MLKCVHMISSQFFIHYHTRTMPFDGELLISTCPPAFKSFVTIVVRQKSFSSLFLDKKEEEKSNKFSPVGFGSRSLRGSWLTNENKKTKQKPHRHRTFALFFKRSLTLCLAVCVCVWYNSNVVPTQERSPSCRRFLPTTKGFFSKVAEELNNFVYFMVCPEA